MIVGVGASAGGLSAFESFLNRYETSRSGLAIPQKVRFKSFIGGSLPSASSRRAFWWTIRFRLCT